METPLIPPPPPFHSPTKTCICPHFTGQIKWHLYAPSCSSKKQSPCPLPVLSDPVSLHVRPLLPQELWNLSSFLFPLPWPPSRLQLLPFQAPAAASWWSPCLSLNSLTIHSPRGSRYCDSSQMQLCYFFAQNPPWIPISWEYKFNLINMPQGTSLPSPHLSLGPWLLAPSHSEVPMAQMSFTSPTSSVLFRLCSSTEAAPGSCVAPTIREHNYSLNACPPTPLNSKFSQFLFHCCVPVVQQECLAWASTQGIFLEWINEWMELEKFQILFCSHHSLQYTIFILYLYKIHYIIICARVRVHTHIYTPTPCP